MKEAIESHLRDLAGVLGQLSNGRGLDGIAELVPRAARNLADSDGATFILREGDECHYVSEDAVEPLWTGARFPIDDCVSGWAILNREAVVIRNIYADERVPREAYRPTFVTSMAMVPIRASDPIGAIGVYWARSHTPSPADVSLLKALAEATSVAIAADSASRQPA